MRIIKTNHFLKQLKPFAKKYARLPVDVSQELRAFKKESAQYLGAKLYKVRVKSSDMKKGKSGAFRLIILCVEIDDRLIPIVLYQKSNQEDITERELAYHLACVNAELGTVTK